MVTQPQELTLNRLHRHSRWLSLEQESSSRLQVPANFIVHDVSTRNWSLGYPEFPGRNVVNIRICWTKTNSLVDGSMCFHFETFDLFRVDCGLVMRCVYIYVAGGQRAWWDGPVGCQFSVQSPLKLVGCLFPIVEMVLNQPPQISTTDRCHQVSLVDKLANGIEQHRCIGRVTVFTGSERLVVE